MTEQLELAFADRRAGQDANLAAGASAYRDERAVIETALAVCVRNAEPFTADDVHRLVEHALDGKYDRNRVSSVMGIWAADHRIVEDLTARAKPSAHRARKGSRNRWWTGNTTTTPSPRQGD